MTARDTGTSTRPGLPRLLKGRRRGLMARLVGLAVLQSAAAVALALLVGALVAGDASRGVLAAGVLAAVTGTALAAYGVRVTGERLGQHYVHELRGLLVRSALTAERTPSLGITIARSTNDLAGVRGWVAQGIAPLVAAVPLLVGVLGLLVTLSPVVAVAAAIPLVGAGTAIAVLAPWAYRRARRLRRLRGRLASRLTDTLHGREGIAAAGGTERELRRVARDSQAVADAAVARARAAGLLQGVAAAAAAALAVTVVATALASGLSAGRVAVTLTVAGVLAAPLAETGRIAELRQNHHAARRVLAPLLRGTGGQVTGGPAGRSGPADGRVRVAGLLEAGPGDRVRLVGRDAETASRAVRELAAPGPPGDVVVDGWSCSDAPAERRRALLGLASAGVPLERGTVARAVRYRCPDADPSATGEALARVGLTTTVDALERGERTELRRGGEPLTASARARLKLARAAYGDPPLLLLDRIDADLDDDGRAMLRRLVDAHPGVVVFASETPESVARSYRTVALG